MRFQYKVIEFLCMLTSLFGQKKAMTRFTGRNFVEDHFTEAISVTDGKFCRRRHFTFKIFVSVLLHTCLLPIQKSHAYPIFLLKFFFTKMKFYIDELTNLSDYHHYIEFVMA